MDVPGQENQDDTDRERPPQRGNDEMRIEQEKKYLESLLNRNAYPYLHCQLFPLINYVKNF